MRPFAALTAVAALNLLCTLAHPWVVLVALGPGRQTDALYASVVVPQLVVMVFAGSLVHVLVPILSGREEEDFLTDVWTFLTGVGVLYAVAGLLLFAAAPVWIPLAVPGFDADTKALAVHLARVQAAGMTFAALASVLMSIYHARRRFLQYEAASVAAALASLGALAWLLPRFGVEAAAWTLVGRSAVLVLLLLPAAGAFRRPRWRGGSVGEAWRRLLPLLAGRSYYRTGPLIDRFLASAAPAGGLSMLHLAEQVYAAGHFLLGKTVAAPMLPLLAQRAREGAWREFVAVARSRLAWMLCATAAVLAGIAVLGPGALPLVFGHGRMGAGDLDLLYRLLLALGGIWIGGAAGEVLASSFYARGDTATPTVVGAAGFTVGIVLKVLGFWYGGIVGLALGTSAYSLLNAAVMAILLLRMPAGGRVSGTRGVPPAVGAGSSPGGKGR
jgi:putative peptidoglycan lipid II flippase